MAVMRALVLLFLIFSVENAAAKKKCPRGKCPRGKCPHGWTRFDGQCYKFFSHLVNWAMAEKNCRSIGGSLASVHSTQQNNFLLSLSAGTRAWIGGHDGEVEGQWLWTDGSQFHFTNWCPLEPSIFGGIEHCLEINYSFNRCWNDLSCYLPMNYICAKPK